jgi:hypothetical protein
MSLAWFLPGAALCISVYGKRLPDNSPLAVVTGERLRTGAERDDGRGEQVALHLGQ